MGKLDERAWRTLFNISRHMGRQIPTCVVEPSGYIAIDKGEIERYGKSFAIDLSIDNINLVHAGTKRAVGVQSELCSKSRME